jgi:Asp-tRNA(Asn)/Glu-tRNA(Gln) amidotransferase A subunit family amidase
VNQLANLSAAETARLIRDKQISPVEVVDSCLARIDERNGEVNAFITVLHDSARDAARTAERAISSDEPVGPLHGVPVAIKDLFDFKAGVRNTFGSVPFANFIAERTSVHIQRIEQAGGIIVGKTNTPEFGHKGVTDNLLVGPTRNPFDLTKNAGGSSGGSAAAVADHMVPIAQGTDGGGSVRIPAALCNVVGFKPTFGRIADPARPDAFATVSPFQHIGSIARTVEDAALLFSVMVGPHPRDPLSLPLLGENFVDAVNDPVKGLRVAFTADWGVFPVEPEVKEIARAAAFALGHAGAIVDEVEMTLGGHRQEDLCEVWMHLSGLICLDVFDGFRRRGIDLLRDHRETLSPELLTVMERSQKLSIADLKRDQIVRAEVLDSIEDIFETYDFIATPTLAVAGIANGVGGHTLGPASVNGQSVDPLLGWCLTYPINFTGHPAISVPAGLTKAGLPVGLQLVGHRFADARVLAIAAATERHRPWSQNYPRTGIS